MMDLTLLMLGAQVRFVFRFEWLTFLPNTKDLLHTSQILATKNTSLSALKNKIKLK